MQNLASLIAELLSNSIYQYVFAGLVAISIFPVLFKLLGKTYRAERINSFEYRAFERFLSPAEHSFFFILKNAVSENYEIFAQVRIADVLYPKYPKFTRERQIALNKIISKHFDYLLCDKRTLSIVAAIELDDKSHQLESRKDRDYFLESACRSAGLKLIRFPCKSDYELSAVREKIINEIKTEK